MAALSHTIAVQRNMRVTEMGAAVTPRQRPLYGALISELIYEINHIICFCLAMSTSKINHSIWLPINIERYWALFMTYSASLRFRNDR